MTWQSTLPIDARPAHSCDGKIADGHFCRGCGRCMDSGCDGLWTLHTGDCPLCFCVICDEEVDDGERCRACGAPQRDDIELFCHRCGQWLQPI